MITKQRDRETISTDERRRSDNVRVMDNKSMLGNTLFTAGIIEIIVGIVTLFEGITTISAFAMLIGASIIISGILAFTTASTRNNWSRLAVGAVSVVAGAIAVLHPLAGWNFLTLLLGLYLLGVGIANLFSTDRPMWMRITGVVSIIFAIITFFTLTIISSLWLGLMIGAILILQGVGVMLIGFDRRRLA